MDVHCWDERMQSGLKCTLTTQHIQTFEYVCVLGHKHQAYDPVHWTIEFVSHSCWILNMAIIGVNSCSETAIMQTGHYSSGLNLLKQRDGSKRRINCFYFTVLHFSAVWYVSTHCSFLWMDVLVLPISAAVVPWETRICLMLEMNTARTATGHIFLWHKVSQQHWPQTLCWCSPTLLGRDHQPFSVFLTAYLNETYTEVAK